ncbi:tripartite tricarboxylate transporter substrate-binding protein [Cupriavidus basilensis]
MGAPAGGTTDTLARTIAQEMSRELDQSVVVENRPGAGGNIAADQVAKSAPDGTTLLMSFTSHTINASLYKKLPFDPIQDFHADHDGGHRPERAGGHAQPACQQHPGN